jgi:hypothetical protein
MARRLWWKSRAGCPRARRRRPHENIWLPCGAMLPVVIARRGCQVRCCYCFCTAPLHPQRQKCGGRWSVARMIPSSNLGCGLRVNVAPTTAHHTCSAVRVKTCKRRPRSFADFLGNKHREVLAHATCWRPRPRPSKLAELSHSQPSPRLGENSVSENGERVRSLAASRSSQLPLCHTHRLCTHGA